MKNQYFGDTRDLFKYDLIFELLLKSNLDRFTFIPMLTRNEESMNGRKIDYLKAKAGTKRMILRNFLKRCLENNRRSIEELEKFFRYNKLPKKIKLTIFGKKTYFSDEIRKEYFEAISKNLLKRSIILVDPDIGLEVKNTKGRGEKYIKYEEIKVLYYSMDRHSILLIFQFIPRVKREKYFHAIAQRLLEVVLKEIPVLLISDNQIVLFILVKDQRLLVATWNIVDGYADLYGLTKGKIVATSVPQ